MVEIRYVEVPGSCRCPRPRRPKLPKVVAPSDVDLKTIKAILQVFKRKNEMSIGEISTQSNLQVWELENYLRYLQSHGYIISRFERIFFYSLTPKGLNLLKKIKQTYSALNWR